MSRKIRIYPPVIVTALVALIFAVMAISSIVAEAEREAAGQQAPPLITLAQPTETPWPTAEPQPTPEPTYTSMIHSYDWDGEDERMLAKIAMAEAEGESVEGKALVILVVLNRVWSDEFPDSIEEVIFQKNQFSPVAEGGRYWTTEPDAGCYEALELVMGGWDESQGAFYFESTGRDGWHSQNLEFLFEFGGHKFYR
ncbi:cell wall hydrolase [Acutalibacter muris]|uniref:cell wall hydrolase n=2 Tax=Eubacteriales TaxID=186802 RepID=UPI00262A23F0|nr:cell wall hydrolase [Acutalibacter muris]